MSSVGEETQILMEKIELKEAVELSLHEEIDYLKLQLKSLEEKTKNMEEKEMELTKLRDALEEQKLKLAKSEKSRDKLEHQFKIIVTSREPRIAKMEVQLNTAQKYQNTLVAHLEKLRKENSAKESKLIWQALELQSKAAQMNVKNDKLKHIQTKTGQLLNTIGDTPKEIPDLQQLVAFLQTELNGLRQTADFFKSTRDVACMAVPADSGKKKRSGAVKENNRNVKRKQTPTKSVTVSREMQTDIDSTDAIQVLVDRYHEIKRSAELRAGQLKTLKYENGNLKGQIAIIEQQIENAKMVLISSYEQIQDLLMNHLNEAYSNED